MRHTGQVIILTVLTIGGTLLGVTTIAGLLMLYQIRQATDLGNSGKAIFAADSGIEWALYKISNPESTVSRPTFLNEAKVEVGCFKSNDDEDRSCAHPDVTYIRSVGSAGNSSRAFGLRF